MFPSLASPPVPLRESRAWRALAAAAALAWLAAVAPARGEAPPSVAAEPVEIEVFVREGCPHCADAKAFLEKLRAERPGLSVAIRDVGRDMGALARLEQLSAAAPGRFVSVPAFVIRGQLLVGFADEATTGGRIRDLVAGRPAQAPPDEGGKCSIKEEAPCADAGDAPDAGSIELPFIGRRIGIEDVGLPVFTIAIGLVDGFNPCSMWVLIMMISMLAAVGDRRRMIAIAGTFVIVEGIAYFAFMAAWLNLFMLIGISRASEIALGAIAIVAGLVNLKDFVAFGRGISLSIPTSAKPGIVSRMRRLIHEQSIPLAIAGTVVLAVLVQFVELLCTSGLPALYTRILTLRALDPWTYYGYLLLYNVMYMLDDVIVLTVGVVTLSQHRLQEKEGRVLKLLSGLVMLGLGAYLLV